MRSLHALRLVEMTSGSGSLVEMTSGSGSLVEMTVEWTVEIAEQWVVGVLVGQDGLIGGNAPVDTQRVIKNTYATIGLGVIELITLVLEDCCFA